jgi:hypothetical protein
MKNKTDLITDIESIPKFVFREVAVNNHPAPTDAGAAPEWIGIPYSAHRAITEEHKNLPLAFTSGRYQLVQFKDAFLPLVDQECLGRLKYDSGFAIMDYFPDGSNYELADGGRIGLTSYNSVNKTSAMIVKFSILSKGRVVTLPKSDISGFYKAHVGKIAAKAADYQERISRVQTVWAQIVQDMSKIQITEENFDGFTKDFETDPRILRELKLQVQSGSKYNLWDLSMRIYDEMSTRYAKSDIHMRKRLDAFVNSITSWGTLLSF